MSYQIFIIWLLNKMQIGKLMLVQRDYFTGFLAQSLQEI